MTMPETTERAAGEGQRKLKILMLHGYTQSGQSFHAKTRALEKLLIKNFPSLPDFPGGIQLLYPTAPLKLTPPDIPGWDYARASAAEPAAWGWWIRDPFTMDYAGLDKGLAHIRAAIIEAGGVDGVIGFSQGAAMAVMVAALLEEGPEGEKGRSRVLDAVINPEPLTTTTAPSERWIPSSLLPPSSSPLRFVVSYAGFAAPGEQYAGFYQPPITIPSLHVIGTLDTVIEESRSLAAASACKDPQIAYHPGGHFVPIGKEMAAVLVAFVKQTCGNNLDGSVEGKADKENKEGGKGESVEDMDVPF